MAFDVTLLQDIANRGRAALDDYRNRQQMSGNAASQALQSRSQTYQALSGQAPAPQPTTGRGPIYDQLLYARNSSRFPAAGANGVIYGQVPSGKKGEMGAYAGFKNAADLWAAVEGKAYGIRQQDQQEADTLRQIANQSYDQLGTGYDEAIKQMLAATTEQKAADRQARSDALSGATAGGATDLTLGQPGAGRPTGAATATPLGRGDALTYMQPPTQPQTGYENVPGATASLGLTAPPGVRGSRGFVQGDVIGSGAQQESPTNAGQAAMFQHLAGQGEADKYGYAQKGYQQNVNEWLASQVDPLQQMQGYADQLTGTPFSQYAQAAGADYGVDPNIIAGKWGPAEDVRDFGISRNLSAIQSYGLPYDEVVQQLKAADAAGQDQQQAADEAAQAQLEGQISVMTGMDAKQLAATTNMTTMQLAATVSDPGYQQADAELRRIVSEGDDQAFAETMQQVGQQRPDLYEVLLAQYKDFIPGGYDLYGG